MEFFHSASDDLPEPDTAIRRPWLISFANLVCILLAFFVLLAHSSSIEKERVEQAMSSLGGSLAFGSLIDKGLQPSKSGDSPVGLEALREHLDARIKEAFPDVKMLERPPGLVLSFALPESEVFAGAGLSPPVIDVLGVLADALKKGAPGYRLEMEVVVAAPDPAAEEMPIARATTLARELIARGAPKKTVLPGIAPKPAGDVVLTLRARGEDEPGVDFGRLVPEP